MTRWRLACDACDAAAWVGPSATGFDAWCEACQSAQARSAAPDERARCANCGARLTRSPRFVELWGGLQQLDAVLAAWAGDATPLATLLPERPAFPTDLTPPVLLADDAPDMKALLAAVARGEWRVVLALPAVAGPRADAARAIAHERLGELREALACWDAVLGESDDTRARLARGSLLARTGRLAEAEVDLWRAGASTPARWCRAAWLVHAAVGDGTLDWSLLRNARTEAGEPSAYWSDPTVGRLLWSLLAARGSGKQERPLLRVAEGEFEHETFWDQAMILVGWARAGAREDAARVAAPLARQEVEALLAEPALAGAPLADVKRALTSANGSIAANDPEAGRWALAEPLGRSDLRRFRIPCARCGRGSIGIDEVLEPAAT